MLDDLFTYLARGGWVMIPILGVSFVLWVLVMDRWQALRAYTRSDLDLTAVLAVTRGQSDPPKPSGIRMQLAGEFVRARTGRPRLDRRILAQITAQFDKALDVRLEVIGVLAAIAPLLGLLGTVLGMIETFRVISDFGTGNARAMAGGISVALVTTQTGLLVAIPGLLANHQLRNRVDELRTRLAETHHAIDRDLAAQDPTRRRAA
ncbi:MAG: MotA/TolQ/ExbB proton channel family protein [Phycisphaerales bacterium]